MYRIGNNSHRIGPYSPDNLYYSESQIQEKSNPQIPRAFSMLMLMSRMWMIMSHKIIV